MKRVMCVYFPKWPIQRLQHEYPALRSRPIVVASTGRKAQVLLACAEAEGLGIRPDMPLAEAQAIGPHVSIHEEDAAADRRLLEKLTARLNRYSPCVGLEEGPAPHSLLADVTGCGAVFGGEERLLTLAARELKKAGWNARLALADTVGAAWALAHTTRDAVVSSDIAHLRALPLAALRLDEEAILRLRDLGIYHVAELLALPRAEVPIRFGSAVLRRLDQATGRIPEVIVPCRALPEPRALQRFEYAVESRRILMIALEQLTGQVHAILNERGWGARRLECALHYESTDATRLDISLFRPSGCLQHLLTLLRTRLEQARVVEPVCALELRVTAAEPLVDFQTEMIEQQPETRRELALLIDRLSSQLGAGAVTRPNLVPDPQPEYACRFEPVIAPTSKPLKPARPPKRSTNPNLPPPPLPRFAHRPLRLWPTPARIEVMRVVPTGAPHWFHWAGAEYTVTRTWGPERIQTGWWRGRDIHRDYYVVSTHSGSRFWLYHAWEEKAWFLHGSFD